MIRTKSKIKRDKSKTKLDNVFSEFIRLRDTGQNGYGKCISCSKVIHWKDGDAGHFVNRQHMSLRYSEKNVNLQCRSCNRFDEGNNTGYMRGLKAKYGESIIDELEVAKHKTNKIGPFEMDVMHKYYSEIVKQLKQQRQ